MEPQKYMDKKHLGHKAFQPILFCEDERWEMLGDP